MKSIFLKSMLCASFMGLVTVVMAQQNDKLEGSSMFAPQTIKIDGRNMEWKDSDFSVNKRTGLSYIISNDHKNLYVTIRSTDVANNTKIMAGGITIAINPDGKRNDRESITLTYPFIDQLSRSGDGTVVVSSSLRNGLKDAKRDSAIASGQKRKLENAKEIKIYGFKITKEALISIYNEHGIKAVADIEKDNSFFYELAIPLQEVGLSISKPAEFAYNVKVNGLQIPGLDNQEVVVGPPGGGNASANDNTDFRVLTSPTDFWGKYTLAGQ